MHARIFKIMLLLSHSHISLKNCAPIRKQYGNEVLGLTRSINHVTVSEIMELVEDITRVKKRKGQAHLFLRYSCARAIRGVRNAHKTNLTDINSN